jgi:hypothetical protein
MKNKNKELINRIARLADIKHKRDELQIEIIYALVWLLGGLFIGILIYLPI